MTATTRRKTSEKPAAKPPRKRASSPSKSRPAGKGSASAGKGGATRKGSGSAGGSASKWAQGAGVAAAVVAVAAIVVLLLASPVLTYMRQNDQREEADRVIVELDSRIDELEMQMVQRSSDDAVRIEALCFGNFVEPGVELYAVAGLVGCVSEAAQ